MGLVGEGGSYHRRICMGVYHDVVPVCGDSMAGVGSSRSQQISLTDRVGEQWALFHGGAELIPITWTGRLLVGNSMEMIRLTVRILSKTQLEGGSKVYERAFDASGRLVLTTNMERPKQNADQRQKGKHGAVLAHDGLGARSYTPCLGAGLFLGKDGTTSSQRFPLAWYCRAQGFDGVREETHALQIWPKFLCSHSFRARFGLFLFIFLPISVHPTMYS